MTAFFIYFLPIIIIGIIIFFFNKHTTADLNRIVYILIGLGAFIPIVGLVLAILSIVFAAVCLSDIDFLRTELKDTKLNRFLFNKTFKK